MTSYISPLCTYCYQNYFPSFLADNVEKIRKEINVQLEKLYVGGRVYQFKGNGSEYLKSKSVFIAPNSFELRRSLAIFAAFAALGYLMVSFVAAWPGYLMIGCSVYFALAIAKENLGENHLKRALNLIKPIDSLNQLKWTYSSQSRQISIDISSVTEKMMKGIDEREDPQIVVFKLDAPIGTTYKELIKVYYIGVKPFLRSAETINGIRVESDLLLRGEDIQSLIDAVKPPQQT